MKILMLNYEFPPIGGGGGQANLHLLKEYAKKEKLSVDLLTSSAENKNTIESFSENITIYKLGIHKKNLHYWRKLEVLEWLFKAKGHCRKLVTQNNYQLIHSFFAFPSGYLCLHTADKIPYIISLRGSDVPGFNARLRLDYYLLKPLFHRIWKQADAVIANSKGLAELARKFEPSMDIGVICNGIDTLRFSPPATIRTLTGRIKLLTVCRLIARKRLHLLIEATALLYQQGIDIELNIAGEGNLMNQLKTLAEKFDVADRINFLGRVGHEQMPSIYQQNHFFVMSSTHEGMSNAMLEAMASGLPVITTPCEGTEELIEENGAIVKDSSPRAFLETIRQVIFDSNTYQHMCEMSRQNAHKFGWSASAEHYLELYQKLGLSKSS